MDGSQSPSVVESFSYRWLVNFKPALESLDSSFRFSLDASDEASFIEMDPRMPPSKRFYRRNRNSGSQDFKFDFPTSQSPLNTHLAHADEIFSDGYVLPHYVDQPNMKGVEASPYSNTSWPNTPYTSRFDIPGDETLLPSSSRKPRRFSRRMFQKYFNFLRPLYWVIRGRHKLGLGGKAGGRKAQMMKSCVYPEESCTSPRISSVSYSADCWRMSVDSDSSIYEAVLHCKRSFGKN